MNRREDWFDDADLDRTHIFVPAIMGVGILLSVFTLVRDSLHARNWRGRDRRVALEAHATAHHVLTGDRADVALRAGLRPRVSYLLAGLASGGAGVYVGIGATSNYFRPGGYVAGIAWLWAVSLITTAFLAVVAGVCLIAFRAWPDAPPWQRPLLVRTPLGQRPLPADELLARPPLLLGWAVSAAFAVAAIFTLVVRAAPHRVGGVDRWVARTVEGWERAVVLGPFDLFGETWVSVALVAVIGLATLRCIPFALVYLSAVAGALLLNVTLKVLVPRPRPPGALAGASDSFPSGHEIQAMLIAGFLPLALLVLTRRRRLVWTAAAVLALGTVGVGVSKIYLGLHWWSDVVAGYLWGGALVLGGLWFLQDRRWHRRCRDCPWSASGQVVARMRHHTGGVIRLPRRAVTAIRWVSRAWVPLVVSTFLLLALLVGIPTNPEGDVLGSQVEQPAQLALVGMAVLAWALAWRWEATGAVLLMLAGCGLGALSALAYPPLVSLAVAAAFLAPAFGFWLAWQHRRTVRAVVILALSSALLLTGTAVAATRVYDHFYGPAHPSSPELARPVDRVLWSWSGGVTTDRATVTAELVRGARRARLLLRPEAGGAVLRGPLVAAGGDRVARLTVEGLDADTAYRYQVEVDGVADRTRGAGSLRTMPDGPASFTVAVGSCARTGSSGAVFDAIRRVNPLLYIEPGDLHYGNPSRGDVALFGSLYRRTLTAPAQAALYRSVPVAYVWDDHDYGPNNADARSVTRSAARAAYRQYVPHYPLPDGPAGAIYQAFTIGRVRFVLTDSRSERTGESMLGSRQRAWLERELVTASRAHALVVWVNPVPWIAPAVAASDTWGGYADERRHIADVIAGADIRNLVMVSGDAHMVAIDDGSHSDYSTAGHPGFPLLHAAALDRPGSVKGGPYSDGTFPGAGQFGTVAVTDEGGASIDVELSGRNWRDEVLVAHRFTVAVPESAG